MKIKAMLVTCLFLAVPAMAHEGEDPGHVEGEFDVESYQLTLQGSQPFGEACYIGVVNQSKDEAGAFFAEIETSFEHEGEGPGRLLVKFDAEKPSLLTATTESGSRINIQLSEGGTGFADALRYAVRWAHEGHVDTGLCLDLKVIHDAADETEGEVPTPVTP